MKRPVSLLRLFSVTGSFLCALVLTAIFLRPWGRPAGELEEQFQHLERNPNAYDVLFLGSSYVYSQISPAAFDAEMARLGTPAHAFTVGFASFGEEELEEVIARLKSLSLPRLKLVVIDTPLLERYRNWQLAPFPSYLQVATWRGYTRYLSRLSGKDLTRPGLETLAISTFQMGARWLNLGYGNTAVRSLWGNYPRPHSFEPYRHFTADSRLSPRLIPAFQSAVAKLRDLSASGVCRRQPEANPSPLLRWRTQLQSRGIATLYSISPISNHFSCQPIKARGVEYPTIRFNDPIRYPELYEISARRDLNHLSAEAIPHYSALVARAVQPFLAHPEALREVASP